VAKVQTCPQKVAPQAATLVFPTSSMNSPTSRFGYTLIRVESSSPRNKLLCSAVNCTAVTRERGGFLFACKGIFGFNQGILSLPRCSRRKAPGRAPCPPGLAGAAAPGGSGNPRAEVAR